MIEPWLEEVLGRRRYPNETPTETNYTLEVSAYWNNDLLDQIESGRRRKVVVSGYRNQKPDLVVEVPLPAARFVLARLDGPTAIVTVPEEAVVAVRREDGRFEAPGEKLKVSAKFPAFGVKINLHERLAFKLDKLTFVLTFVYLGGKARHTGDWVFARRLT